MLSAALVTLAAALAGPTYSQDIAPLVRRHCVECHRPGGGAPFPLTTFADVRRRGQQIVDVTRRRYMPPWMPDAAASAPFENERRLTAAEIAVIEDWARHGFPEGEVEDRRPPVAAGDAWRLGPPDLVVTTELYSLAAEGADVFRTFVASIPGTSVRYVRAFEFRSDTTGAIHHANIKIDRTNSTRLLDLADPAPGYEGAGGRGAEFPDGHFLGWTPGQSARQLPEGLTFAVTPGSDLVFELHMMRTGKPESLRASVALYFSDAPPGPLPAMIRLGRQDIDIPPGDSAYVSEDTYVLPVAAKVLALQPHAHRIARSMRGWAVLPDGATVPLIAIRDWDMSWQETYVLRQPVELPAGSRLSMRYVYDNSARNPRAPAPPRRITFGQTTSSEMGDLWIQVLPLIDAERPRLIADVGSKMLQADITGVEKMVEVDPDNARLRTDLAFCYLEAGRSNDALGQLRRAVELSPASAFHHHDLAVVLIAQQQFSEAEQHLRAAIRLRPDFTDAYTNLGVASYGRRDIAAAVEWFERALALQPRDAVAHHNLGLIFAQQDDVPRAQAHLEQALAIRPDDIDSLIALAGMVQGRGALAGAAALYRRVLAIDPQARAALIDLAWILATTRDAALRDAGEAVRLAERARSLSAELSAPLLDVLGAAYAADGQIDRAIETAAQAVALASTAAMRTEMQQRLDAYVKLRERVRR